MKLRIEYRIPLRGFRTMGFIEDPAIVIRGRVAKAQRWRAPGPPKTESIVSKRILVRSVDMRGTLSEVDCLVVTTRSGWAEPSHSSTGIEEKCLRIFLATSLELAHISNMPANTR